MIITVYVQVLKTNLVLLFSNFSTLKKSTPKVSFSPYVLFPVGFHVAAMSDKLGGPFDLTDFFLFTDTLDRGTLVGAKINRLR